MQKNKRSERVNCRSACRVVKIINIRLRESERKVDNYRIRTSKVKPSFFVDFNILTLCTVSKSCDVLQNVFAIKKKIENSLIEVQTKEKWNDRLICSKINKIMALKSNEY